MLVVNSPLCKNLIEHHTIGIGEAYFFKSYIVLEFDEGVYVNFEDMDKLFKLIKGYYKSNRTYGIIANRLNSYSLAVLDIEKVEKELKNLSAYAVITYSSSAKKNFEYESHFFKTNRKHFDNILEAEKWINLETNKKLLSN